MAAVMQSAGEKPLIHGSGTSPQAWAGWSGWRDVRTVDAAALVPPGRRAVVVAPHPDDEVIGTGLLLQGLAAAGRQTLVVAVTDGDASHPGSARWSPAALARVRAAETGDAASALGLAALPLRLHLPDGGVQTQEQVLVQQLTELLTPNDTVFATWRHDGHPDHEAVGRAAAVAVQAAGARLIEVPVWCWHWADPGDDRLPWPRAVRLSAPVEAVERKQTALQCFRSQIEADATTGQPPILPAWALQRWAAIGEVFFV